MNRLGPIVLLLLVAFAAPAAAGGLDALVAEALAANPDLQAAEARWQMYERKVVPARSLDDPMLTLGLSSFPVDTFDGDQTPMTGRDIVLSQRFPYPGKLAAREESAEQQALWYRAVYEDARLQLARKVKDAYYDIAYQAGAIAITERNLAILDDVIRLTETRYQVGQGLQQDVLKAQVERSRLMDRLFAFRQQERSARAALNALLGRPPSQPLEAAEVPETVAVDVPPEALLAEAEAGRPLFSAYRSLIDRYKAQKRLAELDYRPDVSVFAGYRVREENMADDGVDFVSAGVTLNLPIWREKRREAAAEADAGIRMAQRQYGELRNQVAYNISDAHAQLERSRQQSLLFKSGIIPQATQALQAAIAAYRVGKVEFLSLLDAQMALLRYELDYRRALTDFRRSLARLEGETGRPMDPLP